jgi:hypothetical protein
VKKKRKIRKKRVFFIHWTQRKKPSSVNAKIGNLSQGKKKAKRRKSTLNLVAPKPVVVPEAALETVSEVITGAVPESSPSREAETPEVVPEDAPESSPSREALTPEVVPETILERARDSEKMKSVSLADRFRKVQEEILEESLEEIPASDPEAPCPQAQILEEELVKIEAGTQPDEAAPELTMPEIKKILKKDRRRIPWERQCALEDTCGADWQLPASENGKRRNQARRKRRQATQVRLAREAEEEKVRQERRDAREVLRRRRRTSQKPAGTPPSEGPVLIQTVEGTNRRRLLRKSDARKYVFRIR